MNSTQRDVMKYFRGNIYESYSAYNAWKMLLLSTSVGVVSEKMANYYHEVQNYHPDFFVITQRSLLLTFVVSALHSFDRRKDSCSLYKVNRIATENFIKNNSLVINSLTNLRHKLFAHKSMSVNADELDIPSVDDLDDFYLKVFKFYNMLTSTAEDSSTLFNNAELIKEDIESLFQNLFRGESARKNEISIRYMCENNKGKASDLL